VPPDPDESVSEHVQHFFSVNHRDYLSHQVIFHNDILIFMQDQFIIFFTFEINAAPS
jgi:hypothetical protein